jgi:hypothetical protein
MKIHFLFHLVVFRDLNWCCSGREENMCFMDTINP